MAEMSYALNLGFSCFQNVGNGQRCGRACGSQSLWCEEHLNWNSALTNIQVFTAAAGCLTSCLDFESSGRFAIAVKDPAQWGDFCNFYNLLKRRGYLASQILDGLSTMLSSHQVFSSTMKALGLKATKWKVFERLVARLYLTNMEDNIGDGVIITWNDKIPEVNTGRLRQVDVSIRFKRGFHTYLTVVECRDHDAPTPISHVEAFVEKTRKIQADKGVMISVKGFQGGAIEAARQGGIDLFVLSEQIHGWEPFQQVRETVNYKLGSAIIKSSNSEEFSLVGNDNLSRLRDLKYMEDGTDYIDLRGLLEKAIGDARAKRRMDSHRWSYNPTSAATLDTGNGQISEIREITFNFESIVQRSSANLHLPPRVVSCVLQSARNNDKVIVPQWKIRAPDIKPGLQANKFYSNLFFQKYRCNKVTPKIELTLLDDVQHGNKLQATLTLANDVQDHPDRERYFEITNPTMCSSLEESYSRYIGGRPRIKNPES